MSYIPNPNSFVGVKAPDGGIVTPVIVFQKNVAVQTTGSAADIGTITVPSSITRWSNIIGNPATAGTGAIVCETASGTIAASVFQLFDGPGGTGNQITTSAQVTTLTAAGTKTVTISQNGTILSTSSTIYIHQTTNSANAGTVSFYVTICPLP